MGGRQGWSQQLQDQAAFPPVDFDPFRPANPAQSAPTRETRAFLQPFYTKSRYVMAARWWEVAEAGASNRKVKQTSPPSRSVGPAQSALRGEKKPSFSPFTPKSGLTRRSAGRVGEGARDHSYEWIKGRISPPNTMEASGPKKGYRYHGYQPQQRNFVVLATITIIHARYSGAGGRPRSQLRVDQGCNITSGHYGSNRAEDWTSLPATTKKLSCFGHNHDLSRSLLVCWRAPKIAATSGSGVEYYQWALWKQSGGRLDVTASHNKETFLFWPQSRSFTLAARMLEGAQDRSYEWIRGGILPVDTMEAN
jgi:hypothetical protein